MYMYHQVNSLEQQYPVKGQIIPNTNYKLLGILWILCVAFGSEMEINSSPQARVVQGASSTLLNELKSSASTM